jgi:peroxiredoxin
MNARNFAFVAALLATSAACAALKAGDRAPAFTAPASLAGKPFAYSLQDALAKGPVVVYFYPSAYTQGCNVQAHEFSTRAEQFAAAGASVIGVSLDSIERLNAFSADPDYCAGKLAVASDADGTIARAFGVPVRSGGVLKSTVDGREVELKRGVTSARWTFIIGRDGRILYKDTEVDPEGDSRTVIRAIQRLDK